MKRNPSYIFIGISSLALLVVLIIQVNWIVETARIKEELFNEKANMVLAKTAEALRVDTQTCNNLEKGVGNSEQHIIDSLFNHYIRLYNIRIDYTFEVKLAVPANAGNNFGNSFYAIQPNSYQTCIPGVSTSNGLELKLIFPKREEFILAEMRIPFLSSVLLILVVMVLYWRTILSLLKEKQIAEHTTDFLNNMTHEFKTPLTNIALAGKLMLKNSGLSEDDKVKHYTGIILEENEKLRHQVEQVLSMSALERGEIPITKTVLDLHQIIHDSLKCIGLQMEAQNCKVSLSLEAENAVISGDKVHLTSALCNLIDNAIKYSDSNPEIAIRTSNQANSIILTIADKGIGIEQKYQKNVFQKFFRVPTGDVHNVKGFGLGLAYAKSIMELHKGTIELSSVKNEGTVFTITLPNA